MHCGSHIGFSPTPWADLAAYQATQRSRSGEMSSQMLLFTKCLVDSVFRYFNPPPSVLLIGLSVFNRSTWFWMTAVLWVWWSAEELNTLWVFTSQEWTRGQRQSVEDSRYGFKTVIFHIRFCLFARVPGPGSAQRLWPHTVLVPDAKVHLSRKVWHLQ